MARTPKKQEDLTHTRYSVDGVRVVGEDCGGESSEIVITIPKGMPYVKVRKALEIALLRIR